jgi:hypothetical protein
LTCAIAEEFATGIKTTCGPDPDGNVIELQRLPDDDAMALCLP